MRPHSQGRSQSPLAEDGLKSPDDKVDKVASERRPTAAKRAKYFAKTSLEEKYKSLPIVFKSNALLAGSNFLEGRRICFPLIYNSKNN